jgi:hypothetical protein
LTRLTQPIGKISPKICQFIDQTLWNKTEKKIQVVSFNIFS